MEENDEEEEGQQHYWYYDVTFDVWKFVNDLNIIGVHGIDQFKSSNDIFLRIQATLEQNAILVYEGRQFSAAEDLFSWLLGALRERNDPRYESVQRCMKLMSFHTDFDDMLDSFVSNI
jgi:hypothetical protein